METDFHAIISSWILSRCNQNLRGDTQDGLGSVRTIIDNTLSVDTVQTYDPIGNPMGSYGAGFGFTGEQTDHTGQLYLRARYYDPGIGTFTALDPFEGMMDRPMSLNGYSWVEGNVINLTDASGKAPCMQDDVCEQLLSIPGFPRSVLRAMGCLPPLNTPTPTPIPPTPTPDPYQLYVTITSEAQQLFSGSQLDCLKQVVQNEVGIVGSGIDEQAEWLTWAVLNRYSVTRELDYGSNSSNGGDCGSNGRYSVCAADDGISFRCGSINQIDPVISAAVDRTLNRFQYRSLAADPTFGGAGWRQNPNSPPAGETWTQRHTEPCGEFYCRERQQFFPNEASVASCGSVNYVESVEDFYNRISTRQNGYNAFYGNTRRSTRFNVTLAEASNYLGGCIDRIYVQYLRQFGKQR